MFSTFPLGFTGGEEMVAGEMGVCVNSAKLKTWGKELRKRVASLLVKVRFGN